MLDLNARQTRWMALISEFDFEIKHIKGKANRVEYVLIQSLQAIHLAETSVGECNIKQRIKTLLQEYGLFQPSKRRVTSTAYGEEI
jgi:hypothetical protein